MVQSTTVKGLGTVLVDGYGLTLYLFVPDHRSGRSTCFGILRHPVAACHVAGGRDDAGHRRRRSTGPWSGPRGAATRCRSPTTDGRCTGGSGTPPPGRRRARGSATPEACGTPSTTPVSPSTEPPWSHPIGETGTPRTPWNARTDGPENRATRRRHHVSAADAGAVGSWPTLARKVFREAVEDRVTTSAASLAFHWFLAIFPAILAAVALVGIVGLSASQLRSLVHGVNVLLPRADVADHRRGAAQPHQGRGRRGRSRRRSGRGAVERGGGDGRPPGRIGRGLRGAARTAASSVGGWWRCRFSCSPCVLGAPPRACWSWATRSAPCCPSSVALARSTSDAAWGVVRWAGAMALVVVLLSAYYSFGPNRKREPACDG